MTLTQLRYFVAISDAGLNITLAAKRVHATQPGLSKQLKQLEDELGFLLFSRKGRGLESITPSGQHVLAHARRVLEEAGNISAYAANTRQDVSGRLVLATTHTQARFVLPPAVAKVKLAYPRVSVHLNPTSDNNVLQVLARGEADFALISSAGAPPPGGIAIPLFRWRRQVIVPIGHPLAQSATAPTLEDLAAYPLISYESSTADNSSLRNAFSDASLAPHFAMTAQDADLIKVYVRSGLGVGVLAEMAVSTSDHDLCILPAPAVIPECIAWAVLPRERVLRDYALELLHALAPQIDGRDLRRVLAGNLQPDWPTPPSWRELSQPITL